MIIKEKQIEQSLIKRLKDLKYTSRPDIRDRETLEANFRKHFEALNKVNLTDEVGAGVTILFSVIPANAGIQYF